MARGRCRYCGMSLSAGVHILLLEVGLGGDDADLVVVLSDPMPLGTGGLPVPRSLDTTPLASHGQ